MIRNQTCPKKTHENSFAFSVARLDPGCPFCPALVSTWKKGKEDRGGLGLLQEASVSRSPCSWGGPCSSERQILSRHTSCQGSDCRVRGGEKDLGIYVLTGLRRHLDPMHRHVHLWSQPESISKGQSLPLVHWILGVCFGLMRSNHIS